MQLAFRLSLLLQYHCFMLELGTLNYFLNYKTITMSKKVLRKKIFIQSIEEISLEGLAYKISEIVDHDDVATFIALLEKSYESWDVTEVLINHFDSLKAVYLTEFKPLEQELSPKNLLDK
jgi:hypothetical protein